MPLQEHPHLRSASRPRTTGVPAVFLDRDDTLIYCNSVTPDGDLGDPSLVELMPDVYEALRTLRQEGFTLVCVSNQAGVARGRYGPAEVDRVNARLNEMLDGMIVDFRYCPFHPEAVVEEYRHPDHPDRKPNPGMLLRSAADLGVELARSWIVGDKPRDCEAGSRAGTGSALICGEHGRTAEGWLMARDISDAAEAIVRESRLATVHLARQQIQAERAGVSGSVEERGGGEAEKPRGETDVRSAS